MNDLAAIAASFGEELTKRAAEHLEHRAAMYGDPKTELFNKSRISKLIIDAAGVTGGLPYTPRVHAAVELGKLAVGLLRGDPKEVLADAVANISCLAQVEGIEEAIGDQRRAALERASGAEQQQTYIGESGKAAMAKALEEMPDLAGQGAGEQPEKLQTAA